MTLVLPQPLRHLANAPRGRYRLDCMVTFHHRRDEWLDRVLADRAVRYDISLDPVRGRWYIDASWSVGGAPLPTPGDLAASGARLLGVDLNADHLAACVIDPYGNPLGGPITVGLDLTGSSSQRDGHLRQAISELVDFAKQQDCAGLAIENLGFADTRASGRETLGRGHRAKGFRRIVSNIPSGRFRERIRGMAHYAGLLVIAVDPAYTSRWGNEHWRRPLQEQTRTQVTRHHAAAVAIGRRALGYRVRRRPGVTTGDRRIAVRRATGQAVPRVEARGAISPVRTPGSPHPGGKTRAGRTGRLVVPDLEHRSRRHPTRSGSL